MTRDYTNELEEQRHRDTIFLGSKMFAGGVRVCAAGPKWVEQRSTKLTRLGHTWGGGYEYGQNDFFFLVEKSAAKQIWHQRIRQILEKREKEWRDTPAASLPKSRAAATGRSTIV